MKYFALDNRSFFKKEKKRKLSNVLNVEKFVNLYGSTLQSDATCITQPSIKLLLSQNNNLNVYETRTNNIDSCTTLNYSSDLNKKLINDCINIPFKDETYHKIDNARVEICKRFNKIFAQNKKDVEPVCCNHTCSFNNYKNFKLIKNRIMPTTNSKKVQNGQLNAEYNNNNKKRQFSVPKFISRFTKNKTDVSRKEVIKEIQSNEQKKYQSFSTVITNHDKKLIKSSTKLKPTSLFNFESYISYVIKA